MYIKILITLVISYAFIAKAHAQVPVNQSDCFIKYHYDTAGNRISREFVCEQANNMNYKSLPIATEINDENILVYPNPTNHILYIDLPTPVTNGKVILMDIHGKLLAEYNIELSLQIPMQTFIPGIYMVIINDGKKKYVRKVTKIN